MGQVALGFRNVLVKAAIFFVMAAMLAWMLGGALWPRPEVISLGSVPFDGDQWFWQLTAGGRDPARLDWTFIVDDGVEPRNAFNDEKWDEIAGPFVAGDHLVLGGRQGFEWSLVLLDGERQRTEYDVEDRLDLEVQMKRLRNGSPLLDADALDAEHLRLLEEGNEAHDDSSPEEDVSGG